METAMKIQSEGVRSVGNRTFREYAKITIEEGDELFHAKDHAPYRPFLLPWVVTAERTTRKNGRPLADWHFCTPFSPYYALYIKATKS